MHGPLRRQSGLLAAGDPATARDTVRFLFERQQQPDGSFPRNSLINGATAPDSFGVQLDEVAYPILMARTIGLTDAATYTDHVRRAADFLVAHGPAFGSERWEEQSGWSPSTIAAEIAGLTAAGWIAERNGDDARARIYRAVADHYQRNVKRWTLTTTGPLSEEPYFLRLSKNADPDSAFTYNLGNGGPEGKHHVGAGVTIGYGENIEGVDRLRVVLEPGKTRRQRLLERRAVAP